MPSLVGMPKADRYRSLRSLGFHVGYANDYALAKRPAARVIVSSVTETF